MALPLATELLISSQALSIDTGAVALPRAEVAALVSGYARRLMPPRVNRPVRVLVLLPPSSMSLLGAAKPSAPVNVRPLPPSVIVPLKRVLPPLASRDHKTLAPSVKLCVLEPPPVENNPKAELSPKVTALLALPSALFRPPCPPLTSPVTSVALALTLIVPVNVLAWPDAKPTRPGPAIVKLPLPLTTV